MPLNLPPIVTLAEYQGDVPAYMDAIYAIFKRDFVDSKPVFMGIPFRLKAHPFIDGKEYTFYHFTHDGEDEENRIPNLRRMEKISRARVMIDNSTDPSLKVWRNKRKGKDRILIFDEAEDYLVILDDRGSYILPWTGYVVEKADQKAKLLREYEAYKKTEAAQQG